MQVRRLTTGKEGQFPSANETLTWNLQTDLSGTLAVCPGSADELSSSSVDMRSYAAMLRVRRRAVDLACSRILSSALLGSYNK